MSNVTKIYELRTLGYADIKKELADVANGFDIIKKAKQAAEKGLYSSTDVNDIKKYADEVGKLKLQEQQLRTERQQMLNEQKAINLQRAKELQVTRDQSKANKEAATGYNAVYQSYRELYKLSKSAEQGGSYNFRGQILNYDQLIAKTKEYAAAEQEFRRQFSKDNTLVGEYTSGIVKAFKNMGLDDLIKGQITRAQTSLEMLNTQFNGLQQELSETKVRGDGTFESIEKKMVENRKEAIALQKEITQLQNDFRGAGNIGNQITASIGKGFKDIRGQVGGFMVQYIGMTALFSSISSGVSRAKDEAVALDSLEASMRAVSITEEEYAVNQSFINDLTEKYGVVLLDTAKAFKNFYASSTLAGISADDTRMIFESATQAGAVMKLSQDDINGVLLAFGQIASKGKVQAEELRGQIGERLPGAYSIAAKAIGVTQQELDGMLKKGDVIAKDFLPKFAKELTKTFNTGGEAVEGLSATINRNKNLFTEYLEKNKERISAAITNFTKLSAVMLMMASVIFGLPLPWLIAGFTTLILVSNTWLGVQGRNILAWTLETAAMIIQTAQIGIHNGIRAASTLIIAAYTAALSLSVTTTGAAAVATKILASALALLSSPIAIVTGVLLALVTIVGVFSAKANSASLSANRLASETAALAAQQRVNAEIAERVGKATDNQVARMNKLIAVARDEKVSLDLRKKALNDLIAINPKYLNALTLEGFATGANKVILDKYIDSLKEAARRKAILAVIDAKEAEKARLQTENATKRAANTVYEYDSKGKVVGQKTLNTQSPVKAIMQTIGHAVGIGDGTVLQQLDDTDQKIKDIDADLNNLYETAKKENIVKDVIKNEFNPSGSGGGDDNKPKPYRGARLTGQQKDRIKEIESIRDQELAVNEASFIAQNKTEEQYLKRSKEINDKAIEDKLAFLNQNKKLNAEELKEIAQLKLEKQKIEKETNDKIFEIKSKALTDQFDSDKKAAQDQADKVKNDPSLNVSVLQRAQAQLDADNQILALQQKFNADMDALEKTRNNVSVKNAADRKDAVSNINQAITKDEAEVIKANIEDLKKAGESSIADFNLIMDRAAALIQADNNLSQSEKKRKIAALEREREYGLLVREGANYKLLEAEFKKAYDAGIITLAEYEAIVAKLQELQNKIANDPKNTNFDIKASVRGQAIGQDLRTTVSNVAGDYGKSLQDKTILGVKVNAEEAQEYSKAFSQAISDSYSLAQDAMQGYFDREAAAIRQSLDLQIQRMDIEREQVKARAQSTAEMESIERQYAAKKRDAERQAFERTKELKKKEAKLSLMTELGGIWASVWSVGNPIAAVILGAVMSGLALVRYGLRISDINAQKFEFGGAPGEVPTDGGEFGGKPHNQGGTDFTFKGKRYNAEVKELAIVRTKNADQNKQYTISGNHMQIASMLNELGGGKSFRKGGSLNKFEYGGSLGTELQAPVMPGQSVTVINNNQNSLSKYDDVIDAIDKKTDAINDRIDRLQVYQTTSSVTQAQAKEAKQKSIGTI